MSRALWLGLLAFAVLCALCVRCHAPRIQAGFEEEAVRRLAAAELDTVAAMADGRVLTLRGSVASEAQRQRALAEAGGVPGVSEVIDAMTVSVPAGTGAPSAAPPDAGAMPTLPAGRLGLATRPGRLTLRGVVPTADLRQTTVAQATEIYGAGNVEDRITVDDTLDPSTWTAWPALGSLFNVLYRQGGDLDLEIGEGMLKVQGAVLSPLAKERLLGALGTALPGYALEDAVELRQATTETESLQARLDEALAGKIIEFDTNSANLTPAGRRVVEELAALLADSRGALEISGHTDSSGDPTHNLELSRLRAETVRASLIELGLEEDRLRAMGFGATRPIADNSTAEGRKRNRRTEVRVVGEG